jgi:hypothetical protein
MQLCLSHHHHGRHVKKAVVDLNPFRARAPILKSYKIQNFAPLPRGPLSIDNGKKPRPVLVRTQPDYSLTNRHCAICMRILQSHHPPPRTSFDTIDWSLVCAFSPHGINLLTTLAAHDEGYGVYFFFRLLTYVYPKLNKM